MPRIRRGLPRLLIPILLIPIIPALVVNWLTRTSPPGQQVTRRAQEIYDAIRSRPEERGAKIDIRYRFTVGERFSIRTDLDVMTDDADSTLLVDAADALSQQVHRRSALFGFEVLGEEPPDSWRVAIELREGGSPLFEVNRTRELKWSSDGTLAWRDAEGNPARELFRRHGLAIPGPFTASVRRFGLALTTPDWFSPRADHALERLGLEVGNDTFPPLGGLFVETIDESRSSVLLFEWLGHRRRLVSGKQWTGAMEVIWRGRHESPDGRLHRSQGEIHLRERIEVEGLDAAQGISDVVLRIRQTTLD